jgi:DNA helicase HerA-like ATPase
MNLFLPPEYVPPTVWRDKVLESLAVAFGLGNKQYGIMFNATQKIFWENNVIRFIDSDENEIPKSRDENGILDLPDRGIPEIHPDWEENMRNVTLADLYIQLNVEKEQVESFGMRDSYESILTRLGYYASGDLRKVYASKDPDASRISDLIKGDTVTVLEGGALGGINKKFIIHLFAQGIFLFAKERLSNEGIKKEKLVVFEEAHQVIQDQEEDIPLNVGEDIFEAIFNESRGFGLYNMIIVQSPSQLPPNVVSNCSIVMGHRIGNPDDAELLVKQFNRDGRYDSRDIMKWMFREPIGQCVIKSSKQFDHMDSEPVLVSIDHIPIDPPNDEELLEHHEQYGKDL